LCYAFSQFIEFVVHILSCVFERPHHEVTVVEVLIQHELLPLTTGKVGKPYRRRYGTYLRLAETEELRAVGGWKRNGFVCAVVADARGIGDPTCRDRERAASFRSSWRR